MDLNDLEKMLWLAKVTKDKSDKEAYQEALRNIMVGAVYLYTHSYLQETPDKTGGKEH